MTRVGFYVVNSDRPDSRVAVAMRLTEKAFKQGHRIFINASDKPQAELLNEQLWTFRPSSFLPHALQGDDPAAATIAIGWGQDPGEHCDLLINLQLEVPAFFSRFKRVAEVVTKDEASLVALRTSWKFYQARGYQMEKHDLTVPSG